jgi:hypothetical protein
MSWKISGNYLLVVYEAGEEENPIMTRRFMCTDEKVKIEGNVFRATFVEKQNTCQEIDFSLEISNLRSLIRGWKCFARSSKWKMGQCTT